MSPQTLHISWTETGFPRVSGDEPEWDRKQRAGKTFSPRERG